MNIQNKPAGLGKKHRTFTAGTGKHRSAILIRNSRIDVILITKTSDEDTVVLEMIYNNSKFYAESIYIYIYMCANTRAKGDSEEQDKESRRKSALIQLGLSQQLHKMVSNVCEYY